MPDEELPHSESRFRSLRHRNFRLFWGGQLVSLVGTWMQSVAQAWLLHRLTDSPMMLGLLGFAQFAPVTVFSLWAGVVADRVDKRKLLLITQVFGMLQSVALAVLASSGRAEPWMVLALAFLFGIFNAVDLPVRQSILVEMVGRQDLSNAIALNSAGFNVARIVGPAIAGVLLVTVGEAGCFWINAVSYLPVIVSLSRIRLPKREVAAGDTLGSLRDGIDYVLRTTSIRNLLILLAICGGLGFQYNTLLPVFARDIFRSDAGVYGALVSCFGVGSLVAALSMTRALDRWSLRRNLLIGLVGAGIGLAVFAWSRWLPLTLAMGLLTGFGLILYVASTNTLIQMTTEDRYRGRVMSLYTFMFIGTTPLGALLAGGVAERFGAPVANSVCALLLLGGALWVNARLRVLREQEAARARAALPAPDAMG
jgi:MFS family permease